jgi:hypothetical protein
MSAQNISAFRSGVTELPPVLTQQKSPKTPKTPISFAQHHSQSSVASSDYRSSGNSDEGSSQFSATESDSTVAVEKETEPATDLQDTPIVSDVPKKRTKIKYSLEVYDSFKSEWNTITQDDKAFDLSQIEAPDEKDNISQTPPAIFEVITKADGFDKRRRKLNFELGLKELQDKAPEPKEEPELPPLTLADLKVTEIVETRVEIHSQPLLEAIRQVVDYYPNQNMSGDIVIIHEPYWILIHHEKELRALLKTLSSPTKSGSVPGEEKAEHLKLLLDFVQPQIDRIVPGIEKRLQNKVPTITFDSIWYLLKPGTMAYCQFAGEWIGCMVMLVKGKKEQNSKSIDHWNIHSWFLTFSNGLWRAYTESDSDAALETKHTIQRFEGEKDITTLKVVPKVYWDAIDNGARRKLFEERGQRKLDLMNTRFRHMSHKGETIEKEKRLV